MKLWKVALFIAFPSFVLLAVLAERAERRRETRARLALRGRLETSQ